MSPPRVKGRQADAAVVDVGSNSIRLVMYRLDGRAIWTVFNEKVLAGLGRRLTETGRLDPDGVAAAELALTRFTALIEGSRPTHVYAVATAAVREAKDGEAFCRRIEDRLGLRLQVLSGAREARYSALGVMAGDPGARGVVGDLGGASLELTRLKDGAVGRTATLPLGPFAFAPPFNPDKVRARVARALDTAAGAFETDTLHAVGGAWRSLAQIHMRSAGYPLGIIHQYELSRSDAFGIARLVAQQSRGSLERIEGLPKRRIETLPHAATVLQALVSGLGARRVLLSAYGLREGLIFSAMRRAVRARDPLIAGCAALGGRPRAAERFGAALEGWLEAPFARLAPLFTPRDRTLLAAACRLADHGAQLHPDHRADLVFEQVLRAPIPGMTHEERAFLACAAFGRHTGATVMPGPDVVMRLIGPERYQLARAVGAAVRLGCDMAGRSPELLSHAQLAIKANGVIVQAEAGWEPMLLSEQVVKRAATLAGWLGRELRLRPGPETHLPPVRERAFL